MKADLIGQIDGMKKQAQVMVDSVFSFGELGFQEFETGIVRSEEDGFREFFRAAEATHDYGRGEPFHVVRVGERLIEQRGIDRTRADSVDPNAPVFQVGGPGASKGAYRGFSSLPLERSSIRRKSRERHSSACPIRLQPCAQSSTNT